MKFSLAIAASMAASAIASPVANGRWSWSKKGQDKGKDFSLPHISYINH